MDLGQLVHCCRVHLVYLVGHGHLVSSDSSILNQVLLSLHNGLGLRMSLSLSILIGHPVNLVQDGLVVIAGLVLRRRNDQCTHVAQRTSVLGSTAPLVAVLKLNVCGNSLRVVQLRHLYRILPRANEGLVVLGMHLTCIADAHYLPINIVPVHCYQVRALSPRCVCKADVVLRSLLRTLELVGMTIFVVGVH